MGFFLLYFFIFFLFLGGEAQNTTTQITEFKVGVVLDLDRVVGKMGLSCMSMALSDFYETHTSYKTRLVLHTRDSKRDVVEAASAAIDLLKNVEVQAIVGPITSSQASFMADLGNKSQVPIISFSVTSPSISPSQSPYFIRTAQNDTSQVNAIASIVKAFGWRTIVLIYEDSEYGNGIIPYLVDAFQEIDTRVPYRSVISTSATDDKILKELYKLITMQTRVFIVHMSSPTLGSRLFLKAKEIGMMSEGYSWIITDGLTNLLSSIHPSTIDSMQGVLGVRPYVPRSNDLEKFRVRWKRKFIQENPDDMIDKAELNVYGLWAYDTIWALASAAEKVGNKRNSSFLKSKSMEMNSTDRGGISNLGVSEVGPKLLYEISNIELKGLSGEFRLVDRQLQSFAFQIVNVVGNGGREIGFWTPKNGIVRGLSEVDTSTSYSTSKDNLRSITWPGESTQVPKGWVVPTSGKRLRIGVPIKDGFKEFVNVTWDDSSNRSMVTGYCIDVFKAVIDTLPYAVPYDFIPFAKDGRKSGGSYDELIHQVSLQNFDAVVGDTTIVANRSQYVDFTLPYTESGVSMIVPVRDDGRKNRWIFLKPLHWDLWLTSGVFFVYTGFVIWVLEHRINEDFRGPSSHQLGTTLYFAFSTLVFAHKEKVVSNLARFVVIIWVFVVLILTSSYTANLTSMLTVQRLEPTIRDIQELIKNKENVGYQRGSFVAGLLKQLKIDESQLKFYNTLEEIDDAMFKGTQKGGIAAVFDEIPYIKLVLAKCCAKYTMIGPTYKTDGFGFAFPRGSPLVPDISRAILNVTEGTMARIETFWFGDQRNCPDPTTMVSSNSLTLNSFSGLFLIAAISSTSALLIFSTIFIYNHKKIWSSSNPNSSNSIWKRIGVLARHFDQKDLSSHTFRKSAGILNSTRGKIDDISVHVIASPNIMSTNPQGTPWSNSNGAEGTKHVIASPNIMSTNPQGTPWSNSNGAEGNFSPVEDQSLSYVNVDNSSQEISTIEETVPSVEL